MKRTIIILVTASIAALLLGSCGTTAEKQLRNLDSFVDKVEAELVFELMKYHLVQLYIDQQMSLYIS